MAFNLLVIVLLIVFLTKAIAMAAFELWTAIVTITGRFAGDLQIAASATIGKNENEQQHKRYYHTQDCSKFSLLAITAVQVFSAWNDYRYNANPS